RFTAGRYVQNVAGARERSVSMSANGWLRCAAAARARHWIDPADLTDRRDHVGGLARRTGPLGRNGRTAPGPGREAELDGTPARSAAASQSHRSGHGTPRSLKV